MVVRRPSYLVNTNESVLSGYNKPYHSNKGKEQIGDECFAELSNIMEYVYGNTEIVNQIHTYQYSKPFS